MIQCIEVNQGLRCIKMIDHSNFHHYKLDVKVEDGEIVGIYK